MRYSLYLAGFCSYASISILFPILPLYAVMVGATDAEVGMIVAANSFVAAALMIPFGGLSDRIGRTAPLICGILIYVIAPVFYVMSRDVTQLILVRLLHGVASASFIPAVHALSVDLDAERNGEAIGKISASTQFGFFAGPAIGGILKSALGFDIAFLSCSFLSAIGLVMVLVFLSTAGGHHGIRSQPEEESGFGLIGMTIFVILSTPFFTMFSTNAITSFLPLYARDFGITDREVGMILSSLFLGSSLLRAPSGRLSDIIGRRPVIVSGLMIAGVGIFLISVSGSFSEFLLASVLFGFGTGLVSPVGYALISDIFPSGKRGTALGAGSSFSQLGLAAGASSMGFIAGFTGLSGIFILCSIILLMVSFLMLKS